MSLVVTSEEEIGVVFLPDIACPPDSQPRAFTINLFVIHYSIIFYSTCQSFRSHEGYQRRRCASLELEVGRPLPPRLSFQQW